MIMKRLNVAFKMAIYNHLSCSQTCLLIKNSSCQISKKNASIMHIGIELEIKVPKQQSVLI